ncbi:hypothetical protein ONZ45_g18454 [Pleurotus djamor]|nr:hypothetical protein ONZ45_g18454 [Pleurotus djamor]
MEACARDADGNLLPASQINFFHDPDDPVPISGPDADTQPAGSSRRSSVDRPPPPIHPLFSNATRAQVVGGARRASGRTLRPSARLIDPNNAEVQSGTGKRKAGDTSPSLTRRRIFRHDSTASSNGMQVDDIEEMPPPETETETDTDYTRDPSEPEMDVLPEDSQDAADDSDAEALYASAKAMADADRKMAKESRSKQERSADIRTIFKADEKRVNPDTGKEQTGYWCKVCLKNNAILKKDCFFTGSISTLRTHISRRSDHVKIYKDKCAELGIATNWRAIANKESTGPDNGLTQTNLDGVVSHQPRMPPFTYDGLVDHLVEFIASQDEAFRLVDQPAFRQLLKYLRPTLKDDDIPHRNTIRTQVIERAAAVEVKIKAVLKDLPSKVSFTFDAWTSEPGDPFLLVTGHYITAPPDSPNDWSLKAEQLAFKPITGNHSGKNVGSILVRVIDQYEIREKVGWFTSDNASNNDTAMNAVSEVLDDWDAKSHRVRCMEHSVHLAASHLVSDIAPTTTLNIIKKARSALGKIGKKKQTDLDAIASAIENFAIDDDYDDDDDDDGDDNGPPDGGDEAAEVADALGKALSLVKQIRLSPQARAYFARCCVYTNIAPLVLLTWVRTRWASLAAFLERLIFLRPAVNHFIQTADDSEEVPELRNRTYATFRLTKRDWEKLITIHEALQEPASATQSFSAERHPTLWRVIPVLEFLFQRWQSMAKLPCYSDIESPLTAALTNLHKWYQKLDDTNVYFISLALEPSIKLAYAELHWDPKYVKAGKKQLEKVFDTYYGKAPTPRPSLPKASNIASAPIPESTVVQYGHTWMRSKVQSRTETESRKVNPRDELKAYLDSPLELEITDVVRWWGHHSSQYPTLARIARDYLAIQGSATPSERAFSSAGITGTARRNRLTPKIFEALQILKAAYRNGHVSATEEAQNNLEVSLMYDDDDVDM